MEKTEAALGAFLKEKAAENWKNEAPYLLSSLAPDLRLESVSYREVIGADETLKQFVQRTGETYGYKIVQHPSQKPKVGIVPADADFEFEDTGQKPLQERRSGPPDGVLYNFLRALGKLPASEIDKIVIPTSVLVKLARYR